MTVLAVEGFGILAAVMELAMKDVLTQVLTFVLTWHLSAAG